MLKFHKLLPIQICCFRKLLTINNGEISFISFLNCLQHNKSVISINIANVVMSNDTKEKERSGKKLNGYFGNKINYLTDVKSS